MAAGTPRSGPACQAGEAGHCGLGFAQNGCSDTHLISLCVLGGGGLPTACRCCVFLLWQRFLGGALQTKSTCCADNTTALFNIKCPIAIHTPGFDNSPCMGSHHIPHPCVRLKVPLTTLHQLNPKAQGPYCPITNTIPNTAQHQPANTDAHESHCNARILLLIVLSGTVPDCINGASPKHLCIRAYRHAAKKTRNPEPCNQTQLPHQMIAELPTGLSRTPRLATP